MKLGVNSVLWGSHSLEEAFRGAAMAGYDGIELSAIDGMSEHLVLSCWHELVDPIRDLSRRYGLELLAMEQPRQDPGVMEEAFQAAEALQIPVVNCGPGGKAGDEASLQQSIESLGRLADSAQRHGVTLCVKAHVGMAIHDTPTSLAALEAISSPAFGLDMDPSHIHRAGEDAVEALRAVVSRIAHVHVRDCKGRQSGPGKPEEQGERARRHRLARLHRAAVPRGLRGTGRLGDHRSQGLRTGCLPGDCLGVPGPSPGLPPGVRRAVSPVARQRPQWRPNVLLIAVDSLRADRLGCYGYPRLTTPHLDRLAAEGTLFESYWCPHIPTTPGYGSMLTGTDCFGTGIVGLRQAELERSVPTLPELLAGYGYATRCVGFTANAASRGFQAYLDYQAWGSWADAPLRKAELLNEVAQPEIDRLIASGDPWFVLLRHMDPHAPYLPPSPYDRLFYWGEETNPDEHSMDPVMAFKPFRDFFGSWMPPGITDASFVIASYDGAVAYMDACIARILGQLKAREVLEETVVVLTADHGETLYDHECFFDHHGLYDCTLRIPLIIRYPRRLPAGRRVTGVCRQADLMPTLLELVGLAGALPEGVVGRSLLDLVDGRAAEHDPGLYLTEATWMRKHGWRDRDWKLIVALEPDFHFKPEVELYDLRSDPAEDHNLAGERPEVVAVLRDRMDTHIAKRTEAVGRPNPIETLLDWHGLAGNGPFASSQEAYDTLHIGDPEVARRLQAGVTDQPGLRRKGR